MEKKKTVGIITFHAAYNYGAMLQAYALQHVVDSMGYESEIINFRSKEQRREYKYNFPKNNIREQLSFIFNIDQYISYLKKGNLFEKFLKDDLKVSKREFSSIEDLENSDLHYDIYISGSDQIWNTNLRDFSESFFLKFVNNGKKIAYAASMGNSVPLYAEGKYPQYIKFISDYDHISVREQESEKLLRQLTGRDVFTALDPTLLLGKEFWDKLAGDKPLLDYKYVFGYSPWRRQEDLMTYIDIFSQRNSIKAVYPFSYIYNSDKKTWQNIKWESINGPREFLNYIKFADFVVCHSFHVVVFSLIFGKPFVCLNMFEDRRINQILGILGLKHLIVPTETASTININDYKPNGIEALNPLINSSLTWLQTALES